MTRFATDKHIRELILESLKDSEKSISALTRELKTEGFKLHRLMITGYLRALVDTGYLKEKDVPPSKVYYISPTHKRDIYFVLGENVRRIESSQDRQVKIAAYFLHRVFKRAVFSEELRNCGFSTAIDIPAAKEDEAKEARQALAKAGFKFQKNDRAYKPQEKYDKEFQAILINMAIEAFEASNLSMEGKQVKLGEQGV